MRGKETGRGLVMLAVVMSSVGMARLAWGQEAQPASFRGTVVSASPDGMYFTISVRGGAEVTIKTAPGTQYLLDGQPSNFGEAVRVGEPIKGKVTADGVAVQVVTRLSDVDRIGKAIGSPPEEWQVLKPLVADVLSCRSALDALDKRASADRVGAPEGTDADVESQLEQEREKRSEAEAKLAQARAALTQLLTVKQEWMLVQMGVLE
ncbi:MAG TPA: hypothetical protein VH253_16395 [Phycisphaerae bacterium]|nr:hypothetical protein [Phycisphaerae bacterium]